jgi:ketosteroid isomerase-like protein
MPNGKGTSLSALDTARSFIDAVMAKDADAAVALCADDVEVRLPGVPVPFSGKDGVRQMIRMAPPELVQTLRDAEEDGDRVRVRTLTRAPGIFANYTTWVFTMEDGRVKRLDFELRAAN